MFLELPAFSVVLAFLVWQVQVYARPSEGGVCVEGGWIVVEVYHSDQTIPEWTARVTLGHHKYLCPSLGEGLAFVLL